MSDRVIHSSNDKGKKPMHLDRSQSVSHSWGENCITPLQEQTRLSLGSGKQLTEVKALEFEILDNSQAMGSKSGNEINGRTKSMDSLMLNLSQGSGSSSMLKNGHDMQVLNIQPTQNIEYATKSHFSALLSLAPPSAETSYLDCHIKHQSVSQYPRDLVNSQTAFRNNSAFLPENFAGTTSHNLSPRFHSAEGRYDTFAAAPSFLCSIHENVNRVTSIMSSDRNLLNTNIMTVPEHEKCRYQSHSEIVAHAKYMGNVFMSNHNPPAFYEEQYKTMLNHSDNVFCYHHPPALVEEQHKTLHNHSGINLFRSHDACNMKPCTSGEKHDSSLIADNVFARNHHPPACDEEQYKRMHNHSGINLVQSYDACPTTMHTSAEETRTFWITKSIDSNLCKENPNFRDVRVLSPVEKGSPSKCDSFAQLFSHGAKGVELQVISSSDSEGNNDIQEVNATEVASKNKSSATTYRIDKNPLSGGSSSSKKDAVAHTDLLNNDVVVLSGKEVGQKRKLQIAEIPDINMELPAEPDDASMVDNPDPCPSSTRSLDTDLLNHPEHYGPASSRWFKRFKISDSSNHSTGTKSLSLGEATSSEKVNQTVGKSNEGEINNSKTVPKSNGKEPIVFDQHTTPPRIGHPSNMKTVHKNDDKTRSQLWIGRWHHNPAATPEKKPEAVVVSGPQNSKLNSEKVEEKPFASVGAMALMGKAMNGFKRCNFLNIGALTVWNDKDS